jgi:cell division transport system ATP-binding protein
MIRFTNVSKRYPGGYEALSNINFHMEKGVMAFLTGHSGAGKSTLLKLVALIEYATRGQVFVDGENVTRLGKHRIPYIRRKIGFIFQEHHLLFDRTVFDNVALPLIIAGYRHQEIGRRVRAALDKPMLLLADEPTGNLDPELSREIMSLFSLFNDVGVSVLIASHDIPLIETLDYPVLSLEQGRLSHTVAGAA